MDQWNGNIVNSYKSRGVINTNFGLNMLKWAVCCEVVSGLMTSPARFLSSAGGGSGGAPAAPPPDLAVDSDVVVILAALLCALICVVGLALVARCAWLRRSLSAASAAAARPADKGLKKKALRALPRTTFDGAAAGVDGGECAICLAEFAQGDEIRVLPQCGHGFHVGCVDTWLSSHSSCPSCRRVLVVARCRPPPAESEGDVKAREDRRNRFLP